MQVQSRPPWLKPFSAWLAQTGTVIVLLAIAIGGMVRCLKADSDPYAINPFKVKYRTAPTDPAVRWAGFPSRVGTYLPTDQYHWWRIDVTNRAEVQDAYWNIEAMADMVDGDWNGSYPVTPGDRKQVWRDAFMRCLNLQRFYYMGADTTYLEEDRDPVRRLGLQAAALVEAQRVAGYKHTLASIDMPVGFQYAESAMFWAYRSCLGWNECPSDINGFLADYQNPGPGHRFDALNPRADLFAFGQVGPNPADLVIGRPYPTVVYFSTDTTATFQNLAESTYGDPDTRSIPPPPQYDPFDYPRVYPYRGCVVSYDVGNGALPISVEYPAAGLVLDTSKVEIAVTRDGMPSPVTLPGASVLTSWRQGFSFTADVGHFDPNMPDGVVSVAVSGLCFKKTTALIPSGKSADIGPYLAASNPRAFEPHTISWVYTEFDPLVVRSTRFPSSKSEITNISTRGVIGAGSSVLIAGFIVSGIEPLRVAVRAQGPSLAQFGIQHSAQNPRLEIYQLGTETLDLGGNDDWKSGANWRLIQSYGLNPGDGRESAAVAMLMPGCYTAVVSDPSISGPGVGLIEVFAMDAASQSRLTNVSTRAQIGSGENTLIGGFVLQQPTTVLVRTQGPSLTRYGLSAVAGTKLTIVRQSDQRVLASNTGWSTRTAIGNERLFGDLAAYAPLDGREAAQVITLPAGAYTALVESSDGVPGIGLVEVFNVN